MLQLLFQLGKNVKGIIRQIYSAFNFHEQKKTVSTYMPFTKKNISYIC